MLQQRFCAVVLGLSALLTAGAAGADRPNIVLIMVDDMGFSDLGCYGSEIATPNLDRIASEGLRFTQFYNTAKCEPSRQSLLSGLWHKEYRGGANANGKGKGKGKADGGENRNFVTLAEVLKGSGYTTLMTGKWHIDGEPLTRGFERFFGHLSGATDFFHGDKTFRLDEKPFDVPKENFYTTDANTDYALKFVEEASGKQKPFFLYIAYNAPHYPLQAPKQEIDKYLGKYAGGWDDLRRQRYERQVKLGIIDTRHALTPRPGDVPAWETLSDEQKKDQGLKMAVFAAMVDRIDQNIGRLMAKLKELKLDENTVFMFLSDNGGCPFDRNKNTNIPPWQGGGHWTYDKGWAGACNTPFRWYKQNSHEGGIASPFIVRWPALIQGGGKIVRDPCHLVDIMPTCMELAGAKYPEETDAGKVLPYRGLSLVKAWRGESLGERTLYWNFGGNKAVRVGDWKLVSAVGKPWELYDMAADRTELHDLAAQHPERVTALQALWDKWSDGKKGD